MRLPEVYCEMLINSYSVSSQLQKLGFFERKLYFPVIWRISNYVLRCFSKFKCYQIFNMRHDCKERVVCNHTVPCIFLKWVTAGHLSYYLVLFSVKKITAWHIYHWLSKNAKVLLLSDKPPLKDENTNQNLFF